MQDTNGGHSDSVEPAMEVLECESNQPNREAVTVMECNDQRILLRKG